MTVGDVVQLRRPCLDNKTGTLGVVFYDYGNGVQIIFENGNYDGFSGDVRDTFDQSKTEQEYFLTYVRKEPSLAGYKFKNVMQVSRDFVNGVFKEAFHRTGDV